MSRFLKTTVLYSMCSCLLVACGLLDLKVRTVYFDTNGAEAIPQQSITYGHKVATPDPMPTRKGYSFAGWYANPELNTRYDFNLPVKGNMTLYAKWVSPQEVRLIGLHASMKGETMVGVIDEGSTPPTVTLTLQRSHHFGADLNTAILTKITVSPEGSTTNKQVGDVVNVTLKAGKTITVTSFDDKHSRSYEVLLRYQSDPARVITYNGTDTLGQAVKDTVLLPHDIVLSAYNLAPLTSFGFMFDNVTGKVSSDEYGTVLFERSQLESTTAQPGQVLRLTHRRDTLDLAPYQPYDIWDWRDLQAMRQDLNGSYRLMKDITFPERGEQGLPIEGFAPIGFINIDDTLTRLNKLFTGNFDGRKHTITNFAITRSDKFAVGLFGYVSGRSEDDPVLLKDVHIYHSGVAGQNMVGVMVGTMKYAIVYGVSVVPMKSEYRVSNTPIIKNINQQAWVGAVVGGAVNSSITAHTSSDVKGSGSGVAGQNNIGGLVGYIATGSVTGYATGNVTSISRSIAIIIGGLVGSTIGFSQIVGYATGNVTGEAEGVHLIAVGGLVGELSPGNVTGYATGKVVSKTTNDSSVFIGGVVGFIRAGTSLLHGYARGDIKRGRQNTFTTVGRLLGSHLSVPIIVAGYHSGKAGESAILPTSFTDATGVDGIAVTISSATTQQDFSEFTFGNATGEWTFTPGRWPAINLPPEVGGNYLPQDQPTSP